MPRIHNESEKRNFKKPCPTLDETYGHELSRARIDHERHKWSKPPWQPRCNKRKPKSYAQSNVTQEHRYACLERSVKD